MKLTKISIAVLLFAVLPLASVAQSVAREVGYEVALDLLEMPTSDGGELAFQQCPTCTTLRLRASAATRYVLDGQLISRVEMSRFIATEKPHGITVMQLKGTNELSRVVVRTR